MTRRYRFVAGEDSMDALRLLRRGWAGLSLGEGEVTVRLAQGGAVRVHVDAMEIEPGFHVASVVAEVVPLDVALPDGEPLEGAFPFSEGGNDVLVFRGVSWLESLPDLGDDVTVQFSGPAHLAPAEPEAVCDTTEAVVVLAREERLVIRVGLRPGHLDMIRDPEEVADFLETWGYGGG